MAFTLLFDRNMNGMPPVEEGGAYLYNYQRNLLKVYNLERIRGQVTTINPLDSEQARSLADRVIRSYFPVRESLVAIYTRYCDNDCYEPPESVDFRAFRIPHHGLHSDIPERDHIECQRCSDEARTDGRDMISSYAELFESSAEDGWAYAD